MYNTQRTDSMYYYFLQFLMGKSVRKATLLVQVGTASPAFGCVTARKTAKTEQMNSNVVSQQILPFKRRLLHSKLK